MLLGSKQCYSDGAELRAAYGLLRPAGLQAAHMQKKPSDDRQARSGSQVGGAATGKPPKQSRDPAPARRRGSGSAAASREIELTLGEQPARPRDDAHRGAAEADEVRPDRERLLVQIREANEKLAVASALADEVIAARATIASSVTALRDSEARYRMLYDSYQAAILRSVPPELHHEERDILARVARGESVRDLETVRLRKDVSAVEGSITASPVKDATGTIVGVSKVARDITAQRRVEKSLRQNAALFSSLIAQAPMGTYVVDAEFRVRQVNDQAMPVFASVPPPLIGRDFQDVMERLWGPDVGGQCADIFRHTLATGERYVSPPFTEKRHDLGIEQTYEWETQRVTLPDGAHGVVCYFHEVTERTRATEALRASEQRMRLATEATQVGIWEWNVATNQIRWDAQMFRIYGIAPTSDGFVDYAAWSGAVVPEDLPETEAILQDCVRRRGRSERTFRIRRRDDGACRHIAAVEIVRAGAEVEAEWVVGTNLDFTERKRAEEELRRLAAQLSDADRHKNEFLATLAHELRNPLAPIRTGLEVLRLKDGNGAETDKVRTMMERQLDHMVHLVDDLLDLSRISRGKLELRTQRIALAAALNDAVETSRPVIEARGHELTVVAPPEPIFMDADPTRVAQVFANLLINAAKYSDRSGKIRLAVERQRSEAVVSVTDTGIGILPELLPEVFAMFAQVDRSLEKSQGGLGIGLWLVKQVVEMHGGSVEARSEGVGKGSEFVVRLPVASSSDRAVQPPTADDKPAVPSGRRRILVADDNEDAAELLAELLTRMGNEVRTANDGAAAVDLAAAFGPDVILLDIGMPTLNGYEACRRIREQPWGEKVVLIALTGWGRDEDKRQSQDAGFDHHMVKPLRSGALKQLLDSLPIAPGGQATNH